MDDNDFVKCTESLKKMLHSIKKSIETIEDIDMDSFMEFKDSVENIYTIVNK